MPLLADQSKRRTTPAETADEQSYGFSWYIGGILLLMMLYVLSVGPAERLCGGRTTPPPAGIVAFYKPLNILSRHCGPAKYFLDWYVYGVWVRPQPSASRAAS